MFLFFLFCCGVFFPTLTTFNWELRVIINWFLATPGCRCERHTPADRLGMVYAFIYLLTDFFCLTV